MLNTLGHRTALVAIHAERYVLSLIFLYFAWIEIHTVLGLTGRNFQLLHLIWIDPPVTQGIVLAEGSRHVIAFLLNFLTSILLLVSRRPSVLPHEIKDIAVPLGTTFFILLYDATRWFPISVQKSLCPQSWQIPSIFTGLLLCVIGPALATWTILYLRRSFGILVVVRKVVLGGPYRWVRHPMYVGYIWMLAGLLLVNFSAAYFVLVPLHILLLIYRARLEEARLCENSAEYREYQKRVGFLFPKSDRPITNLPEIE